MKRSLILPSIVILSASLILGAVLQAWLGPGDFLAGWLAGALLLALSGAGLLAAWRLAKGGRGLAWIVLLAFVLRLGLGTAMSKTLPVAGYPEPEQQAGYLSKDAFARDTQAWQLASSEESIEAAFSSKSFFSDQYGGMLAFSALIYRVLSPDAHRSFLILILSAFFAALGIPFFWAAVRQRWGDIAATAGAWILALYPESVFWGASQMREPFLITFIAIGLWGAVTLRRRFWPAIAALAICLGGLLPLSTNVALVTAGVLAMWIWLDYLPGMEKPLWNALGWLSMAAGVVLLAGASWTWLHNSNVLDIFSTEQSSGWVQAYLRLLGKQWQAPFITVYGLIRPLLPAAVIEPSIPVWKWIFTWRALGWYLLLPVCIYALFTVWRAPEIKDRRQLVWAGLAAILWTLIASYRGGGDASDNPRYRVIFLVWMALLAGWAWAWARAHGFRWLVRWGVVDAIFLLAFTQLYLARYFQFTQQINIFLTFGLIGGLSLIVLGGGWGLDRWGRHKPKPAPNSSTLR
jgi:hypothetical protein